MTVESESGAPASASDSESPAQERPASRRRLPLERELSNLRAAVEAVMDRSEEQSRLLETVVRVLQETNQEMRETLEIMQQAIAGADDQTDKLVDVTDALIVITQAQQQMLQA